MKRKLCAALIYLLAFLVKEYKIEKGNFVTWDEAHFGKFSQFYLSRKFYFDVHPPLGKLLTALSGYIYGQSEDFVFTSSDNFPNRSFDYVGMRRMHAISASVLPLSAYLILYKFGFSFRQAFLFSLLFIFENGTTSISRLILLDSHLLMFTSLTILFLVYHWKKRSKGEVSHKILLLLGISIGCTVSVKWIGCLTMLFVGLYIIYDLDCLLKEKRYMNMLKLFGIYSLYLLLIPAVLYIGFFYLHFAIIINSSTEDGFVSPRFQMTLTGSLYKNMRKYISFGQAITLRGKHGYLHSHDHEYPSGVFKETTEKPKLKQATGYSARDSNNNIYFQKVTDSKDAEFLQDNDKVTLLHAETSGYFEVQNAPAHNGEGFLVGTRPGSLTVSGVWVIKKSTNFSSNETKIHAISDKFYVWNEDKKCYLTSTETPYPAWGFRQHQITCSSKVSDSNLWSIEENLYASEPNNPLYDSLALNFPEKFIEYHALMWKTNKNFLQDPNLTPEGNISKPYEWPLLLRGLKMSQWGDHHKFYLLFNPLSLLMANFSILGSPVLFFIKLILYRRNKGRIRCSTKSIDGSEPVRSKVRGKTAKWIRKDCFMLYIGIGGWFIHYVPFFFVPRVLYIHHYFPALFFSFLTLCYFLRRLPRFIQNTAVFATVIVYLLFSPLSYGFFEIEKVRSLKLLPGWNFTE